MHSQKQLNKERWKTIKQNEKYMISSFGRLKSKTRWVKNNRGKRKMTGQMIKLYKSKNGYMTTGLDRMGKSYLVHRLVAQHFIPNPLNKPCVNHKDGDKGNNNISNLDWCTYSENELWSFKHLGKKSNCNGRGKFGINSPSSKQVAMIDNNGKIIKVFGGAMEAERQLFNKITNKVSAVCRGVYSNTMGLRFKWIDKKTYHKFENKVGGRNTKYVLIKGQQKLI